MSNQTNEKESKKMSFWELINGWEIIVPQLQREYAQGRTDELATQIRESLLDDMYKALTTSGNDMVLNFVYGETKGDSNEKKEFIPVDGQQRLTTLFLLHFYIFLKNEDYENVKILEKFSYRTRDTSRRFCEYLCSIDHMDFAMEKISAQITNQSWFTGNMRKDPTVEGMLRMLDDIHRVFKDADAKDISDKLVSDSQCPITFLWLKMENFQKTDDLYIKMNARGKVLSDFEIFKAKLQGSAVLDQVLDLNDEKDADACMKAKVAFISKFNNEFIELFYSYFKVYMNQDEEIISQAEWKKRDDQGDFRLQAQLSIEKADRALMTFIQNLMRDIFFIRLCKENLNSKTYRNYYYDIAEMRSGSFFRFIEKGKLENTKLNPDPEYPDTVISGIKMIVHLLEILSQEQQSSAKISIDESNRKVGEKRYFDEQDILQTKFSVDRSTTFKDHLIAYGVLAFIEKFKIPKSDDELEGYSYWKRIIFNLSEHANLRSADNVVFAMKFVADLIEKIAQNSKTDILQALSGCKGDDGGAALKQILPEEIAKAKLILSANAKWEELILDAEKYYEDGSIGFLLSAASKSGDYEDVDISEFEKYFNLSKDLFTGDKKQNPDVGYELEQALLCMDDKAVKIDENHEACTGHLKMGSDRYSWCFYNGDFKEYLQNQEDDEQLRKRRMLDELMKELSNYPTQDIQQKLKKVISARKYQAYNSTKGAEWKESFLSASPLFDVEMGDSKFKNAVAFVNNEVLLLSTTTVRGFSMELHTFEMYQYAKNKGKEPKLKLEKTQELKEAGTDFPGRYFILNGHKIGYLEGEYHDLDDKGQKQPPKDKSAVESWIKSL